MNRDFKGIWIPKEIWLDTKLNWSEKILLTEIDSLSNLGECFATNDYFAEFMGLSKSHISRIVSQLSDKKYLAIKLIYKPKTKQVEKRILTVVKMGGYTQKCVEGIRKNADTPIRINAEDNNTVLNNTYNKVTSDKSDLSELHEEICKIFNKNSKLTDKRKKLLRSRLKDTGRENIIKACKNVVKSEFHMGKNDRGWVAEPYWCLTSEDKADEWSNKTPKVIHQQYKTPDRIFQAEDVRGTNLDKIAKIKDDLMKRLSR